MIGKWLPLITASFSTLIVAILSIQAIDSSVQALNKQLVSESTAIITSFEDALTVRLTLYKRLLQNQAEGTLLRNSLADSEGLENYLKPHLDILRLSEAELSNLAVLNSIGEPIVWSGKHEDTVHTSAYREKVQKITRSGKPHFEMLSADRGRLILPIWFPPTAAFEGSLLATIDMNALVIDSIRHPKEWQKDKKFNVRIINKTSNKAANNTSNYLPGYTYTKNSVFHLPKPFDSYVAELSYTRPTIDQRNAVIEMILSYAMTFLLAWVSFFILAEWIRRRYVEPIREITSIARGIAQPDSKKHLSEASGNPAERLQQSVVNVIEILNKSISSHEKKIKLSSQELNDTKEKLELIAKDAGVIAFSVNVNDGNILYRTDSLNKFDLLTTGNNLHWRKIFKLLRTRAERKSTHQAIKEAAAQGTSQFQVNIPTQEGARTYDITLKSVNPSNGMARHINFFAIDVTDKSKLHQELFQSEQRKTAIINGLFDGLITLKEDFTITEVNPAAEKILGRRNIELLGKNFYEHCISSKSQTIFRKYCENSIAATGENPHLKTKLIWCMNTQHENIPVEVNLSWLLTSQGRQICLYLKDLRKSRAQELAISKKNAEISTIFSLSPDGIASFDHGRLSAFNEPLRLLFVMQTGELKIGMSNDAFWKLIQDRSTNSEPESLKKIQGSNENVIVIKTPKRKLVKYQERIPDESQSSDSKIYYFHDATEEFELHEMKSRFLATAAHELRTPLTTILGFSELLSTGKIAEKERDVLHSRIFHHSLHLNTLINDLLDLAKIDSKRGKILKLETLDLTTLLSELFENVSTQLNGRRIFEKHEISLNLPDKRALMARIDKTMVKRAVLNLLSNAAKYSQESDPIILSARIVNNAGKPFVKISVADKGIGMTTDELSLAVKRFWRADSSSGKILGTGLGLSLVKEIVEMQDGKLDLASSYGTGTTASILFPHFDVQTAPIIAHT